MAAVLKKCCVTSCANSLVTNQKRGLLFFNVPTNDSDLYKWKKNLGVEKLESNFICANHFFPEDFQTKNGLPLLRNAAIPKLTDSFNKIIMKNTEQRTTETNPHVFTALKTTTIKFPKSELGLLDMKSFNKNNMNQELDRLEAETHKMKIRNNLLTRFNYKLKRKTQAILGRSKRLENSIKRYKHLIVLLIENHSKTKKSLEHFLNPIQSVKEVIDDSDIEEPEPEPEEEMPEVTNEIVVEEFE